MILKAYIENYGSQAFDLVDGSVIKTNLNETLDSGAINITNITTKLELFPYQFVKLVSTDNTFSKYLIIDNFVETIENLDENIYDYVINLASPLKILEKVQLPNRTVIHSLVSERETLSQVISRMMILYCPKVKKTNDNTTWTYDYIFDWSSLIADTKLSSTYCPDLSFNAPTLREVLTTLMLVVGYLPTINHRTLTFVDLRANATNFNIQENRIYSVKRSNSVDSYVNTLQVQADSVLDTNNKVVNEMIGFRDRENVFLKHTENLKLETRFPIESINKLELRTYAKTRFTLETITQIGNILFSLENPSQQSDFYINNTKFVLSSNSSALSITNVAVKYYYDVGAYTTTDSSGYNNLCLSKENTTPILTDEYASLIINPTPLTLTPSQTIVWTYAVISFLYNGSLYKVATYQVGRTASSNLGLQLNNLFSKDITDIVFEEGKRKLLSKDYNLIAQAVPYSSFKLFYYLTLSYRYGGREITGFSNTWNEFTWFGGFQGNFMEALWEQIKGLGEYEISQIENSVSFPSGSITGYEVLGTTKDIVGGSKSKFSLFFFNIEYRPFNDVNIRYTKEINDLPFAIEQLDKQEASIPMLDEFSYREQEKVNRLGNNVLQIHQSQASDLSYINDLNTLYEDSVVFSREIAFYDDCFEVNYVASKDYVLKNYFTALQTKYRAYEYVDYNQTVLRKENQKVFVYIGTTYLNADDYVVYAQFGSTNNYQPPFLWSALNNYTRGNDITFKYQISGNGSNLYKNDLSVITYKNNIVFTSANYDSVSWGVYIENGDELPNLGGYTQGWYINDVYDQGQFCLYTTKALTDLMGNNEIIYSDTQIQNFASESLAMPQVNAIPNLLSETFLRYSETRALSIKEYYKSQNEVLSQTLQFEYYTDTKESGKPYYEWTEKFVELNSAVFDRSKGELQIFGFEEPTELVEEPQDTISGTLLSNYATIVRTVTNRGIRFYLSNMFNQISGTTRYHCLYRTFKVVWYDETSGKSYDVFAIQIDESISSSDYADIQKYNSGNLNAYFSMNDTKTNKVYQVNATSGLWEQSKEIAVNTTTRILK